MLPLRFLLTLLTILCFATIAGASVQEARVGVGFEKVCVLEGETHFSLGFVAAKMGTQLSVDDKLARYLLNPEHPIGGPKAKWFEEALGFTRSNADDLAKQLTFDPAKAVQTAVTEHGTKFNQIIDVVSANGRTIPVKVAWIRDKDGVVRIVALPYRSQELIPQEGDSLKTLWFC